MPRPPAPEMVWLSIDVEDVDRGSARWPGPQFDFEALADMLWQGPFRTKPAGAVVLTAEDESDATALVSAYEQYARRASVRVREYSVYQVGFTTALVVIGVIHAMIYALFRAARENLFFAVFCLSVAGAMFSSGLMVGVLMVGSVVSSSALLLVYTLFADRVPRHVYAMASVLLLLGFCSLLPGGLLRINVVKIVFLLSTPAYLLIAWKLSQAVYRRQPAAALTAAGFLAAALGLGVELSVGNPSPTVPIIEAGALGLAICLSVNLARGVASTNRELSDRVVEVETLSERNLAQERAIRERMEEELEEARQLQLSLLPQERPLINSLALGWKMQTATEVGGDYYDYSLTDEGTLTLCIGDATGHGMDSGVVVTGTKSLFQTFADAPSITDSLTVMSRSLKGMNLPRMGMAITLLRVEDRACTVSSAGMPPVMVFRAASGEVEEIEVSGYPLGVSDSARYEEETFEVAADDVILMMSDGLPERLNSRDEYFDYDRTKALFAEVASGTPEVIVERMLAGGEEWAEGRSQDDDITLVVVKAK